MKAKGAPGESWEHKDREAQHNTVVDGGSAGYGNDRRVSSSGEAVQARKQGANFKLLRCSSEDDTGP